jgi:hypothetical protein
MPGIRADINQCLQDGFVADCNKVPRLSIPGRLRPAAGVKDGGHHLIRERLILKLADGAFGTNSFSYVHHFLLILSGIDCSITPEGISDLIQTE